MSFPSHLIDFQERFPDEESCWRYLREVRWPQGLSARGVAGKRATSSGRGGSSSIGAVATRPR